MSYQPKHRRETSGNKGRIASVAAYATVATVAATGSVAVASSATAATQTNAPTVSIKTKTVTKKVASPVIKVADATMFKGQRKVVSRGTKGRVNLTINLHLRNARVIDRTVVNRVVTVAPTPTTVKVGTKAAPAVANIAKWHRIAKCESGGNWHINTGNGYYGGLQFNLSTWRAYGGKGMPHHASKFEQMRIAEKVRKARGGYGAWPTCGKR